MIDEKFLQSAVNIRRSYLKISNKLENYHEKAKQMIDILNETVTKLDNFKEVLKKPDSKLSEKEALDRLLKIVTGVEEQGQNIEKLTEPLNAEIERLSKDEQELYVQIKTAYPQLTDEQILGEVQDRLRKEGLS